MDTACDGAQPGCQLPVCITGLHSHGRPGTPNTMTERCTTDSETSHVLEGIPYTWMECTPTHMHACTHTHTHIRRIFPRQYARETHTALCFYAQHSMHSHLTIHTLTNLSALETLYVYASSEDFSVVFLRQGTITAWHMVQRRFCHPLSVGCSRAISRLPYKCQQGQRLSLGICRVNTQ